MKWKSVFERNGVRHHVSTLAGCSPGNSENKESTVVIYENLCLGGGVSFNDRPGASLPMGEANRGEHRIFLRPSCRRRSIKAGGSSPARSTWRGQGSSSRSAHVSAI